jgi:hypothetical protein
MKQRSKIVRCLLRPEILKLRGEIQRSKIVRCLLRQESLKGEIHRGKIVRCLLRQGKYEELKLLGVY